MCNEVVHMEPCMLEEVPNCFKTRSMCEGAAEKAPSVLRHVPDYFKTPEMFIKFVEVDPWQLKYVPEDLITQEMCNKAVGDCTWQLKHVPNQHKTREMCNRVVSPHNLCFLQNVPELFEGVIQQRIKTWYNIESFYDNSLIEWHESYKRRKAKKAKIKEKPLPIAWHPDCVMDWCMPEDEKRRWKQQIFVF